MMNTLNTQPIRITGMALAGFVMAVSAASVAVVLRVDVPSPLLVRQVARSLLLLVPALAAFIGSWRRPRFWLDYAPAVVPPFCLVFALAVLLLFNVLAAVGVLVIN